MLSPFVISEKQPQRHCCTDSASSVSKKWQDDLFVVSPVTEFRIKTKLVDRMDQERDVVREQLGERFISHRSVALASHGVTKQAAFAQKFREMAIWRS